MLVATRYNEATYAAPSLVEHYEICSRSSSSTSLCLSAASDQVDGDGDADDRTLEEDSLCLSVASNLFDEDDDDDDERILEADLRSREPPNFTYEWEVMKEIPVHNCNPRKLKENESNWLPPLCDENGIAERGTGIESVQYNDDSLTTDAFEDRFVSSNGGLGVPCVIQNVPTTDNWPAMSKWKDEESLVAHYGDVALHMTEMFSVSNMGKAHAIRIPTSQYVEYAKSNDADFPFYPFERDFSRSSGRKKLLSDFSSPRFFRDDNDLYATSEETRRFFPWECHRSFLLGGKRSGSNLHKDPKGSGAWNTLLAGRKRWVFFPPHIDPALLGALPAGYKKESAVAWWLDVYPRLAANAEALGMKECIQHPGQTLWTPPNWYHCILNLEDFTLAITSNTLSIRMLAEQCQPSYPEPFPSKYPEIADSFRAMLGESVWTQQVLRLPVDGAGESSE